MKRDEMTIVVLGLIDLSRFFGNYLTTLKVTSYRKPLQRMDLKTTKYVSTRTIQYEFHGIFEAATEVSEHSICEDPVTIEHVVFYLQFGSGEGLETIT